MIDRTLGAALIVAGSFGALIAFEVASDRPVSVATPDEHAATAATPASSRPTGGEAGLLSSVLDNPLFSPTRRPQPQGEARGPSTLAGIRLAGIVIEPERRIAIFSVPGAKPVIRVEGESLGDWRIATISAQDVSLSGPAGTQVLEPKPDLSLARPSPAIAAAPRPRTAAPAPIPATAHPQKPPEPSLPSTPPAGKPAVPEDLPKSP